MKGESIISII